MANTLYVVLRGEFAMYTDNGSVRVLAPEIPLTSPPKHEYRAGGWPWPGMSLPPEIPRGASLRLTGTDATGLIDVEQRQLLPKIGVKNPQPQLAYCQVTLPRPVRLMPGILEDAQHVTINVTNPPLTPYLPAWPTVVSILKYEYSGALPKLLNADGTDFCTAVETIPAQGTAGAYAVLHIIASATEHEPKGHAQEAFRLAAALLGANATIDWPDAGVTRPGAPLLAHAPKGLSDEEVNLPWYLAILQTPVPAFHITSETPGLEGDGNCGQITP